MVKKVLSVCMSLLLAGSLCAQMAGNNALHQNKKGNSGAKDITFSASDIQYWVGTGSNSAVVIVAWDDNATPTALAWGVHWTGSTTATGLLDSIVAHDSRFSYSLNSSMMQWMSYNDGTLNLQPNPDDIGWWCYYQNGDWAPYAYPNCPITNGDVIEVSESCSFDMTTATAVTDPNPTTVASATIDAEDIVYWVGNGNNEVVFTVNWADTALAWGYRFSSDSVLLSTIMDNIAEADPRFSYSMDDYGYLADINFIAGSDTLGKAQFSWWEHLLNGYTSAGMYSYLHNGDFSRWADPTAGIVIDSFSYDYGGTTYWSYIYAYPQTIIPVSVPNTDPEVGPFCGAVGTEGCTAIVCNDNRFKGWATGCTIVRGPENISDPNFPSVTYGTEEEAIGPATTNTMDVVSLGDGGSATLTFEHPIKNGEGYDFAVFENSFNDYFLELAYVEVSSDGVNFVRFPATSLTQTHTQVEARVDPTFINNLAGKYRVGYGTPFDLEELRDSANLDINNITHVRVIDVVGSIDPQYGTYDAFGHLVNDPFPTITYSSGFDLDGVGVINQSVEGIDGAEATTLAVYPNPANDRMVVNFQSQGSERQAVLFDMSGRSIYTATVAANDNSMVITTSQLPNGIYMLRIGNEVVKVAIRH